MTAMHSVPRAILHPATIDRLLFLVFIATHTRGEPACFQLFCVIIRKKVFAAAS